MKRFFTFLMAVWALLSISQTVKAVDFCIMGTFDGGNRDTWTKLDGKNMDLVGTNKYSQTYQCTKAGQYRFRFIGVGWNGEMCPEQSSYDLTQASPSCTVFYTDQPGKTNNYFYVNMESGKTYTFTFDDTSAKNRKVACTVSGSEVVTKVIKLFNSSSELTGSNGRYSLDLTSATADAAITLTIDGTQYGLTAAQTISTVGTTSDIAFTTEGTAALTLKAGLIYSLAVTEDGKMTVVAKEKGVAVGNYYLVGNFFDEDGENINYDKKYFRFTNSKGDGSLSFDIPASLKIKAQVYASDGTCYGPATDNGEAFLEISKTKPTATAVSVNGDLVAGDNYWTFKERGLDETGIYTITITVDAAGTPTEWNVTYDKSKRMAYFLVDPNEDHDAVVHPTYAVVKDDRSCNNNFYGSIYLEAGQHCFVVGNIKKSNDTNIVGNPLTTTPKLYLQGNGGLDPTTNIDGSEKDDYTKIYPYKKEGFTYSVTKSMVLEYNPSKGHDTPVGYPENHGIGGEILDANKQITDKQNPITSVQIVGNGVVGSWELSAAEDMHYNKILDCWEYTFKTNKGESADNKFRFIANGDWKYNWGEESIKAEDQARTPYTDKNKAGHEASLNDPNELGFTTNGTAENRNGAGTYGDMIFNRPAGEWTIRLFTRTLETEDGGYVARHAYTITGSESKDIYLTYRTGKFIRTYSNDKPMNPDNDNVKIYEVYRYVPPKQVDNIYTQGKIHLRQLNYVPANVGVVLIGEVPADGNTYHDADKLAFSLLERAEESVEPGGDYRQVWTKATKYIDANDQWNNYLVPTVTANNNLGNAQVDESGKVIYRYFGLGNYYRTNYHRSLGDADTQPDYIGFFRFTADGKSGANKAYLSIPANAEVGDAVGATYGYIDYNGQLLGNKYDDGTLPESLAKIALVFDDLVDGNEVTGIKELETEDLNNDKYYNLQGIEVAHPVKGVYIHNGKKVIVK